MVGSLVKVTPCLAEEPAFVRAVLGVDTGFAFVNECNLVLRQVRQVHRTVACGETDNAELVAALQLFSRYRRCTVSVYGREVEFGNALVVVHGAVLLADFARYMVYRVIIIHFSHCFRFVKGLDMEPQTAKPAAR